MKKLAHIRETRKMLNNFLLTIIKEKCFYVSIKEAQKGKGSIYIYNYDHKGNNSKKKAFMYVEYIHCHNNDATLLKNINNGLLEIVQDLIIMNYRQNNTFKTIIEMYHYNDRNNLDIGYMKENEYMIDLICLYFK